MKLEHCIFDPTITIDCKIKNQRSGVLNEEIYHGPRQINCPKHEGCSKCGWNPLVEAKRKKKNLQPRHGYIGVYGWPEDVNYIYKGVKLT